MYAWMTSIRSIYLSIRSIYLSEVLRYSNSPRLLRSSSQNILAVPRSRLKTCGDRAFSVVAPKLWNQLLPELRGVETVDQFRTHLKTCLFTSAFSVMCIGDIFVHLSTCYLNGCLTVNRQFFILLAEEMTNK